MDIWMNYFDIFIILYIKNIDIKNIKKYRMF